VGLEELTSLHVAASLCLTCATAANVFLAPDYKKTNNKNTTVFSTNIELINENHCIIE